EASEGLVAAVATAGLAKVAGVVGEKLQDKFGGRNDEKGDDRREDLKRERYGSDIPASSLSSASPSRRNSSP
ncbi:MAG TPA: hypothetical protein VH680_16890, partial [Gemmatimonadales bacterium]